MLIWFGIGQPVTLAARQLVSQWGSAMARQRMLQAYAAALVVYTLLPLDLTLSLEEIGQKWQRGRVHLMPFRAQRETGMMLAVFMRDLLLFVPIGVMLRLGWESRPRLRSVAMTMLLVVAAAAALEVAKLFVFTNHSDTTKIIARAVGGWLGAVAVGRLVNIQGAVAVGHRMRSYQRLALSLLLVGAVACMAMLLLWEPYHRVTSRREFHEQLGLLLGWPLAGYYWVGEWTALTQLVQFALLFVPIGMLLAWGMNRRRAWSAARQVCVVMVVAGLIGIVAEVGQAAVVAYVPYDAVYASAAGTPLFEPIGSPVSQIDSQRERILQYGPLPDLTDLAAYLAGAVGGWLMARMFLARIVDAGDRSRAMPHAT